MATFRDLIDKAYTWFNAQALAGYATGVTPFASSGTSEANTAKTITVAAVAGKSHYVTSFEVVIKAAAAVTDIDIVLTQDAAGTPVVLWSTVIGAAAAVGTRAFVSFPQPIKVTAGKTVDLVIDAGGASVVTVGNVAGFTL